jgi:hypothetical protein
MWHIRNSPILLDTPGSFQSPTSFVVPTLVTLTSIPQQVGQGGNPAILPVRTATMKQLETEKRLIWWIRKEIWTMRWSR